MAYSERLRQLEQKLNINLGIYKVFRLGLLYFSRCNKNSKLLNNLQKYLKYCYYIKALLSTDEHVFLNK